MSTGTLDQSADPQIDALIENNPQVLALARKLISGAAGKQLSPYRRELIERLRAKNQKTLQPMTYQSYRLMAGKHTHCTKDALAEAVEINKNRPANDPVNPQESTFLPGDIITPQSDAEALLMDQDPGKFQPVGLINAPSGQEDAAALLAEVNRLKAIEADKDRRIAELEEAAKKKNRPN